MKFIVTFLCTTAVCVSGATEDYDPTADYKIGDRFFYFPDSEGKLYQVDSQEPVDYDFINSYSNLNITYLLYTRSNPNSPQNLVMGDSNSVINSFYDSAKNTTLFAHGWKGNAYSSYCQLIKEAFLENEDLNFIIIDWSKLANQIYLTAKNGVPKVGSLVGAFIAWLISLGFLIIEIIHLLGFSLGGHLVGNAGRALDGEIPWITALDPAGPLWSLDSYHIEKTDGQHVLVFHTNAGILGTKKRCGDSDIYFNGGTFMPGCNPLNASCSHGRSNEYLASSVKNKNLIANECNSMLEMTLDSCSGPPYTIGDLTNTRSGIFRGNTK